MGMKATKLSPLRGILQVMGEAYQEGSVGKAELLLLMHKERTSVFRAVNPASFNRTKFIIHKKCR